MRKKDIYEEIEIIKGMKEQSTTPHIIIAALAAEALKYRLTKKVELNGELYQCPSCKMSAALIIGDGYCSECGQALDWSDIYGEAKENI